MRREIAAFGLGLGLAFSAGCGGENAPKNTTLADEAEPATHNCIQDLPSELPKSAAWVISHCEIIGQSEFIKGTDAGESSFTMFVLENKGLGIVAHCLYGVMNAGPVLSCDWLNPDK